MSYKVTITADSVAELAGRLLAMGAQLASPAPAAPQPFAVAPEPIVYRDEVLYTTPTVKDPTPAPAAEPEPVAEVSLDYDKDVAPKVLALVKAKSRETAIDLLNSYGVTRASEMNSNLWPELLERINALMEA